MRTAEFESFEPEQVSKIFDSLHKFKGNEHVLKTFQAFLINVVVGNRSELNELRKYQNPSGEFSAPCLHITHWPPEAAESESYISLAESVNQSIQFIQKSFPNYREHLMMDVYCKQQPLSDVQGSRRSIEEIYGNDPSLHRHFEHGVKMVSHFVNTPGKIVILWGSHVQKWFDLFISPGSVVEINGHECEIFRLNHPEFFRRWASRDVLQANIDLLETTRSKFENIQIHVSHLQALTYNRNTVKAETSGYFGDEVEYLQQLKHSSYSRPKEGKPSVKDGRANMHKEIAKALDLTRELRSEMKTISMDLSRSIPPLFTDLKEGPKRKFNVIDEAEEAETVHSTSDKQDSKQSSPNKFHRKRINQISWNKCCPCSKGAKHISIPGSAFTVSRNIWIKTFAERWYEDEIIDRLLRMARKGITSCKFDHLLRCDAKGGNTVWKKRSYCICLKHPHELESVLVQAANKERCIIIKSTTYKLLQKRFREGVSEAFYQIERLSYGEGCFSITNMREARVKIDDNGYIDCYNPREAFRLTCEPDINVKE